MPVVITGGMTTPRSAPARQGTEWGSLTWRPNAPGVLVFVVVLAAGLVVAKVLNVLYPIPVAAVVGALGLYSVQIALPWERLVLVRLGQYQRTVGPGVCFLAPFIQGIAMRIDTRVVNTPFAAEQTLTEDTVPVDVDAVLFWIVQDAEKAALAVQDYRSAVAWAAQTALRDVIGKTALGDLLVGRERIDAELQTIIDQRTAPWGIRVQSVEIRDVIIPQGLQDAMSREAQAERERRARVILGDAERQIAENFVRAGDSYVDKPIALHLRAMNMLYEGLKEKGALIVVPSTAVESMGLGTIAGLSALFDKQRPAKAV